MNIELYEVVVQDVSDDALELVAGAAQGGSFFYACDLIPTNRWVLAIADR